MSENEVLDEITLIEMAKEIYKTLGRGYPECVYHKAFEVELRQRGIPYESERVVPVYYKDTQVGYGRADLILKDFVMEFKSLVSPPRLPEMEQINHYMRHLNIKKGIIINFGQPSMNQRESIDYVIIKNDNDTVSSAPQTP